MGSGRTFNKAPVTRPKKSGGDRRRRDLVQKKRLIALGMPEELVVKMTTREIKDHLKRPTKIKIPAAQ